MEEESTKPLNDDDIPPSLRRGKKEPSKILGVRLPLSWCEELRALAREFDQDVGTFIREATEDWLRRARKVHQTSSSSDKGRECRRSER